MILFESVKWRNMLSTGNAPIDILLNRSPSTLIVGENGAGKSTIIDAICFALFNKGFRNVSKSQLLNSINQKGLEVELKFSIGSKSYKVVRGVKPSKFEIYVNGDQLNQDADARDFQTYLEEHVLKLNYKSFTQIVVLGSASFTPFMQLPQGSRREIIEDLLDIRIFSTMNSLLKEKSKLLNEQIRDVDNNINVTKEKVRIQDAYIKTLSDDQDKKIEGIKQSILDAKNIILEQIKLNETYDTVVASLEETIKDKDTIKHDYDELKFNEQRLRISIKTTESNINFYNDHTNCPTCKQSIEGDIRTEQLHTGEETLKRINEELDKCIKEQDELLVKLNLTISTQKDINNLLVKKSESNNAIYVQQQFIKKLETELADINSSDTNVNQEKERLKNMAKEVLALNEKRAVLSEEGHYQNIATNLLKDTGIKTKVIKQYLPVMNKLVNKYLAAMDFFVKFELDEAFNETIKSRHRDDFSYASFSEGEKQRIDLALMLTFRSIAKLKNTCNTNLILMDEVFDSSLDNNGTDYLLNLLNTLGDETNVFVISHKGDVLFDKFRSTIKFEKYQNFSRIAK